MRWRVYAHKRGKAYALCFVGTCVFPCFRDCSYRSSCFPSHAVLIVLDFFFCVSHPSFSHSIHMWLYHRPCASSRLQPNAQFAHLVVWYCLRVYQRNASGKRLCPIAACILMDAYNAKSLGHLKCGGYLQVSPCYRWYIRGTYASESHSCSSSNQRGR